jgi:hypothetical protein
VNSVIGELLAWLSLLRPMEMRVAREAGSEPLMTAGGGTMVTVTTLTVLGDCTTVLQLAGCCSSLTLPPAPMGELQEPVWDALI